MGTFVRYTIVFVVVVAALACAFGCGVEVCETCGRARALAVGPVSAAGLLGAMIGFFAAAIGLLASVAALAVALTYAARPEPVALPTPALAEVPVLRI